MVMLAVEINYLPTNVLAPTLNPQGAIWSLPGRTGMGVELSQRAYVERNIPAEGPGC